MRLFIVLIWVFFDVFIFTNAWIVSSALGCIRLSGQELEQS